MIWLLLGLLFALVVAFVLLEVRVRRPDELVLHEAGGVVRQRTARLFLRRFSLSIRATVHTLGVRVAAETSGHLGVDVQLALTVAAHPEHLHGLVRAGGWTAKAVEKAARELELVVQSVVGGFVEQRDIETLSREELARAIQGGLVRSATALGLEVVAVSVQSVTAVDPQIADAIRQRESARVLEQSRTAEEEARVAATRARVSADERIADFEHALEMKRLGLRQEEEDREATIARRRIEEENARRRLQLEVDRQEVDLLRGSPELLILTPQVARLAEASQSLRNARTVVSLSGGEGGEMSPVLKALLSLVERAAGGAGSGDASRPAGAPPTLPRRGA